MFNIFLEIAFFAFWFILGQFFFLVLALALSLSLFIGLFYLFI